MVDPEYTQGFRLVSEAEVGWAMRALSDMYNKLVEPAGALAYAAARQRASYLPRSSESGRKPTLFVVPVCGANVTRETYDYFQAHANGLRSALFAV
jgi:threonine dehydratase